MTTENNDELISVREAAKECGRNMETVRRWIWSGKLPARKLGNQLFIKRGDLVTYCRLSARSLPAKVAERATKPYEAGRKEDFLERAIAFRNKLRAGGYPETNTAELVKKSRERRIHEVRQSLKKRAIREHFEEGEVDLLERVREVRNRIFARTGTLFDASRDIKKLRKERTDELLHLR